MINEDYVSFETAKLLKEKGFNEITDKQFFIIDKIVGDYNITDRARNPERYLDAPTLQMVMKWLREVHNIAIETEWEHLWYAYIKPMTSKPSEEDYYQCKSPKYEIAVEDAIKYCLENLI